jgi:RNA polymerase sigma-70 factor (ECF subfamily)
MDSNSTQIRDTTLLERYRAGDSGAFDELFRRYRPMVLGVCRRELGDIELAEDAASAVFLVLHEK